MYTGTTLLMPAACDRVFVSYSIVGLESFVSVMVPVEA